MHVVEINGQEYKHKERWDELTLADCADLYPVIDDIPDELHKYYEITLLKEGEDRESALRELEESLTDEHYLRTFPEYYGKVLVALSNIPEDVMSQVLWDSRELTFKVHSEKFVIGMLFMPLDLNYDNFKKFTFKKVTYHTQKEEEILGKFIPMKGAETIEFLEASQMMTNAKNLEGGVYERGAHIIAILCRPKGEEYDEKKMLKRAEIFKDLPMSVVFQVFFSLLKSTAIFRNIIPSSIQAKLPGTKSILQRRLQAELEHLGGTQVSSV